MKFIKLMVIPAVLLLVSVSQAEYYKYTDEKGVVHFTDNLLEVPQSQRGALKAYDEIKSTDEDREDAVSGAAGGKSDIMERENSLRSEKDFLDEEYEALAAAKTALEEESQKPRTNAEDEAFTDRIEAYNAKTADYEKKRMAFKEKVDAFNADAKAQ